MFELNNEELNILKVVRELNDSGKKSDYYAVIEKANADTARSIPIVSRLDNDGYVFSNGLVYRYLHITEKGRKTLKERGL